MSRQCRLWSFFQCALDLRGSVGFFCRGILRLSSIILNSPFEYDVILKGQSYPVQCYLESVEEYSEGKTHESEPEPGNGNVNTVYFVNQARGNTRISRTEFVYAMNEHAIANVYSVIFELPS